MISPKRTEDQVDFFAEQLEMFLISNGTSLDELEAEYYFEENENLFKTDVISFDRYLSRVPMEDVILRAFNWSDTIEGYHFWLDLSNKWIKSIQPSPEVCSEYWLCSDCAEERGANFPEGHVCTVTHGQCPHCGQDDKTIIPWVDFNWPKRKTEHLRD